MIRVKADPMRVVEMKFTTLQEMRINARQTSTRLDTNFLTLRGAASRG